ncbi:MAG: hypothetical protein K2X38_11585 [Gemmataceae bacterium]|nr:hypothetical protein [Gemmataceae bacterium]
MMARMLGISATFLLALTMAFGQGPGADPSGGFRNPFDPAPSATPGPKFTAPAAPLPEFANTAPQSADKQGDPSSRYSLAPQEKADPNQDIQVMPQLGPWMICITTYSGQEAPQMARDLAMELRNGYKTGAYVFNHGAEERRKEYLRVKAIVDKQKEYLAKNNLPSDYPIRVRYMRIEEQCAVMVGGFPSEEAARRGLEAVRKLTPPDPNKVKLDKKNISVTDPQPKDLQANTALSGPLQTTPVYSDYINPFHRAFICRNPAIKHQEQVQEQKWDLVSLRRFNSGESFCLLECKKPLTLVVKQFQTPHVVEGREKKESVLDAIGLGKGDRIDSAAHSAHNLAELLRKAKLESYVLHTKYTSIVTVGGYDSLEDPNLRAMQNLLETRLRQQLEVVQLMPKPMPMQIPR